MSFAEAMAIHARGRADGSLCRTCSTAFFASRGPAKGKPRDCDTCLEVAAIERREAAVGAERDRLLAEATCPYCEKVLRSKAGRDQHVRAMHQERLNQELLG